MRQAGVRWHHEEGLSDRGGKRSWQERRCTQSSVGRENEVGRKGNDFTGLSCRS